MFGALKNDLWKWVCCVKKYDIYYFLSMFVVSFFLFVFLSYSLYQDPILGPLIRFQVSTCEIPPETLLGAISFLAGLSGLSAFCFLVRVFLCMFSSQSSNSSAEVKTDE